MNHEKPREKAQNLFQVRILQHTSHILTYIIIIVIRETKFRLHSYHTKYIRIHTHIQNF